MDASEIFLQLMSLQGGFEFLLLVLYSIFLLSFKTKQFEAWAKNCVSDYEYVRSITIAIVLHILIVSLVTLIVFYGFEVGIKKQAISGKSFPACVLVIAGVSLSAIVWNQMKKLLNLDQSVTALVCVRKLNLIKILASAATFVQFERIRH